MARWLVFLWFLILLLAFSCTQKMVCPAYQSAFIYDKNELRKKFSYFNEDSTPKVLTASKNKYLIGEVVPYRKKVRQLSTVPAKPVNPVVPDSLQEGSEVTRAELDKAARSVIDSVYVPDLPPQAADSVAEPERYVITKDREVRVLKYNFPDSLKYDAASNRFVPETPRYYVVHIGFNIEQDNYMWYLRDVLILPDVKLARMQAEEEGTEQARKRKGIRGFFSNVFRKKPKKAAADTLRAQPVQRNEEDEYQLDFNELDNPPDTGTAAPPGVPGAAPKKKSPFGFLKKNKGKSKNAVDPKPARREEDDGF